MLWETYSESIATGQVGTISSLNYYNDREQKGRCMVMVRIGET